MAKREWAVEPRNDSGGVAAMVRTPDGGAMIVTWLPKHRLWILGGPDLYELSTAAPASAKLLAELGVDLEAPIVRMLEHSEATDPASAHGLRDRQLHHAIAHGFYLAEHDARWKLAEKARAALNSSKKGGATNS